MDKEDRDFFGFTPEMTKVLERELSDFDGFCLTEVVKRAFQEVKLVDPDVLKSDKR